MNFLENRRGSALIETPLILLVFLLSFIEIIDVGQLMFLQSMLLDRVRAGARYASVSAYTPTVIANVVVYNDPAGGTGAGLFGLQTSMVSVQRYGAGLSSDRLEIVISNYPLAFYGPLLASTFRTRTFRAVMPIQGMGSTS
jgi:hypothetical protein